MPKTAIPLVPVSTLIVRLQALLAFWEGIEPGVLPDETIARVAELDFTIDVENTLREVTPNPEESRQLRELLQKLIHHAGDDRVRQRAEELLEKGW